MVKAPSKRRPHTAEDAHLNITSLIDVLTILLVFLLKSYSAEPEGNVTVSTELKLPVSASQQTINEQTTSVTITKNAVMVDNKTEVAKISGDWEIQGVDPEMPFRLPSLISALEEISDKKQYIADNNDAFSFDGKIIVIGDEAMPSRVLAAVLYSVGQAGFDKIQLLAINKFE